MAHLIERYADGTDAFAGGRVHAWHRLGTVFDHEMTADEALDAAKLRGWNVRLAALQVVELTEEGVTTTQVEDRYATVRTNPVTGNTDVLGVGLSQEFHPVQNEAQVAFLNALTDQARLSAAGSLRGGRQVFFCCRLPGDLLVGGVDQINNYLAVLNGHDGSLGFTAVVSPVRVVCANTWDAALGSARQRWSIRHTSNITNALESARQTLDLSWRYVEAFQAAAEALINTQVTDAQFDAELRKLLGDPREEGLTKGGVTRRANRLALVEKIYNSPTTAHVRGTAWGAYQAVAEMADHADGSLTGDKAIRRALATVDGSGLKQRAFQAFAPAGI